MAMQQARQPNLPIPRKATDMGRNQPANLGRLIKESIKSQISKTHYASDSTYSNRSQGVEAQFSSLQSLADVFQGLINFMVGKGLAGQDWTLVTDFGTFNLGMAGTSNNPLGFINQPGFGQLFNPGFSSSPGGAISPGQIGATISPPNIMSGVTSSGPSGGVSR